MDHGVLLAGKDSSFLQPLATRLGRLAMRVQTCLSGQEALALASARTFDVAILVSDLADMEAVALCRTLRARGCDAVIFICDDLDLAIDVVVAHEAGADDFLLKSLDPLVIEAKVRRALRRNAQHMSAARERVPAIGVFCLPSGVSARNLTRFEERLLCVLTAAHGEIVSADVLIKELWGHASVEARTLYEHISTLRAKIRAAGWTLVNVRGKGYRLARDASFIELAVSPSTESCARSL